MTGRLDRASEHKRAGGNVQLADFVRSLHLLSPYPFKIVEGVRTKERQRQLVRKGKSKTLNSKHLIGRAGDIAPVVGGNVSWEWRDFTALIEFAKALAVVKGLKLKFGYDWGWDAPHIEMDAP